MIFDPLNPYDIEKSDKYYKECLESGKPFEIKKMKVKRSLKQNAYLHLIIGWFACESGYSIDWVKFEYYKKICNKEIFEQKIINKYGKEITDIRSSSDLNTDEMALSITRFRNWSASVAGIYLPDKGDLRFITHAQQAIETNKEFL